MDSVPVHAIPRGWRAAMVGTAAAVAVCCAGVLWTFAIQFEYVNALLWGGFALVIPSAVWLVLAVVGGLNYRGWWRAGLIPPAIVAVTLGLLWFEAPGRVGWALSRQSMDQAAAECATTHDVTDIGVYTFATIQSDPATCRFYLHLGYPSSRRMFLYHRDITHPTATPDPRCRHLGGSWHFCDLDSVL
ncbi:hypothetical protein [Nocardia niigatensis]|uniref:hypothetical protein n=1 Tax=Nocardia niigatensis TaxID=209249 RepID=UPI0003174AF4|nr:hypothetical protein [Nocardia niigatensis]